MGQLSEQLELLPIPPLNMENVRQIESQWPKLSDQDEPLRSLLSNPLSDFIQIFHRINPVFEEILVTDQHGRLIASTNRTSDYWQADEAWWTNTIKHPAGSGILHNIHYDKSAGILAFDGSFPIYNTRGDLLGTLKSSLHATNLLQQQAPKPWNESITRDIVFPDSTLLLRLNPKVQASSIKPIRAEAMQQLIAHPETAQILECQTETTSLAVAVPIKSGNNLEMLYMVVHHSLKDVMAPINAIIRQLTIGGAVLILVFFGVSYYLSILWFARPIDTLRRTAQSMSKHIHLQEEGQLQEARHSLRNATQQLIELESIRSKDELKDLAIDFSKMGSRVLNFHRQLERKLTEKSEELNADLVMAREFQQALLSQHYPEIPNQPESARYRLSFNHIYYPALSLGGDFFDISKVSNHRVRILVADVMGHGARSALMTAILYTLISGAKDSNDPAQLLQSMNKEFCALCARTSDTIFVTAAHIIIDTQACTIRYATAGHPAPLLVEHVSGKITELLPQKAAYPPAAGLIEDATYESSESPITQEQTLLVYTDGAVEATNPNNDEFGLERLKHSITNAHEDGKLDNLTRYLIENLENFMDTETALDDICLVSVDITQA